MSQLDPHSGLPPLSSVLESVAASLGAADFDNRLHLAPAHSATVLLIDGLGAELVAAHPDDAPNLNAASRGNSTVVAAGFPATTSVSLTSLSTGRTVGQHGMVGYTFRAGADGLVPQSPILNTLRWCAHGDRDHDLIHVAIPEDIQSGTTIFQRCRMQGFVTRQIVPSHHIGSGLSRAAFRGAGQVIAAETHDGLRAAILAEMTGHEPTLAYAYYGGLDLAGHLEGPGSESWRQELRSIDEMVGALADELPAGRQIVVTGDHGMVDTSTGRFDIDTHHELTIGTTAVAGEARVRHIYTEPGAVPDVQRLWQETLGGRATVVTREEAIDAGWFGPVVTERHKVRIGDVIAAARGVTAMVRSVVEPLESQLVGQHGSWDSAEQLVPAIVLRGTR